MSAMASLAMSLLLAPSARAFWLGPSSQSRWADRAVALDGTGAGMQAAEGDESDGLSFAFANDDKDLYVRICPHTKTTKEQMAGIYGQDLFLWLEPPGKGRRKAGLKVWAPERPGDEAQRSVQPIGLAVSTASAARPGGDIEAKMIPVKNRGGIEARIPLRYFGSPPPKKIFIGVEAAPPHGPAPGAQTSETAWSGENGQVRGFGSPGAPKPGDLGRARQDGVKRPGADDGTIELISLWVQVTFAAPPELPKP